MILNTDILEILERGAPMWQVIVPNIGSLSCYSLRWGIVHVMEYASGHGFDVYVPATASNRVDKTVAELKRWAGDKAPR